jgi:isoleucyl-tRNA synthetase
MNNSFLASTPDLPVLESEVLAVWEAGDTFKRTLQVTESCDPWVFYDGPPFANGLPHYGHLLTGYAKDTFPRFQTMKGRKVERVFGWDTHGLPAELEAMKRLGMTQTSQVKDLGVEAFNNVARDAVLKYTEEWETYVTRQARWVDFEGGYKTLDLTYMESVVWAFKALYEKGLMYESYKVLPYCWQDETPLSTHELSMDDDGYKARTDLSATVAFVLSGPKANELELTGVKVLAWTTTPWTLPMNKALAVNPELNYVVAFKAGSHYLLEESLAESYGLKVVERVLLGEELVGLSYEALFPYAPSEDENSFTVLPASGAR